MAFGVTCKSCQARFLLNDDLLRRKVAGRVVTVRCRQCHATIEVDASDVDPTTLPEAEKPAPPVPALGKHKAPRPAPAPPRPAKSTLMGIGAPRAAGATELVALSPGLLDVRPHAVTAESPRGFPEPPPPPGALEVLGPGDWDDVIEATAEAQDEAAPESLDDFAEELPPSVPPEEEMPSSTGTPSLKALTHHDEQERLGPRADAFLANMTAAMNGGIMLGAPTIDVSHLAPAAAPEQQPPTIDVPHVDPPARGAKTLPLFSTNESSARAPDRQKKGAPAKAAASPDGSLSPAVLEPRPPDGAEPAIGGPRERKNVVAPTTRSTPPAAALRKTSGLAAPLLLALAAAAGFFIWKRSATPPTAAEVQAEPPAQQAAPPPPPVAPTTDTATSAAPASSTAGDGEDLTFETVPGKPVSERTAAPPRAAPVASPSPAETPTATTPNAEAKPEPAPEPTPPAEPAGPFDRAAATAALTASAGQASACRKEGDPSGVASVVVTFAPSGRVTSANIGGPPFAGTPTGGCIASALRKTKVPAFDGDRVTVSKTVVIQ